MVVTAVKRTLEREDSPHHTAVTAVDLLLITAIVWITGGVRSEYYLLYYLPVILAGIRLNARDGIAASALAGVLYSFVALAGQRHPIVLTSAPSRVLAVCVSAIVLVVFFSLLKREVTVAESLRETLHSSLRRVAAIYNVAHAANTGAELAAVLPILLEHAAGITRADSGAIFLRAPDGRLKASASYSPPSDDPAPAVPFPPGPAAEALDKGFPVLLDPGQRPSSSPDTGGRALVYIPLTTAGGEIGVLALASRPGRKFGRPHIEFLKSLCSEAALAIENAKLRSDLRRLAVTDHLTGLPSRREVERRLIAEVARCRRYQRPLAILMMDVDDLKLVNDEFGHAAGDELLRSLGHMLATRLRLSDIAGRIGGDEFLAVLPETNQTQAKALADRVIEEFPRAIADIPDAESMPALPSLAGLSIGVAATQDGALSASDLIARADAALYEAKRAGKNRSHAAVESPGIGPAAAPRADRIVL